MTVHLIKLCVGADSVEDLIAWRKRAFAKARKRGDKPEHAHVTRMVPRRREEIIAGGSLYWVIKGMIQARQRVVDIRPFKDEDGIGRCRLVFDPKIVRTRPQPRRAFQGWRYLKPEDAPPDLAGSDMDIGNMPPRMRTELAELGLI